MSNPTGGIMANLGDHDCRFQCGGEIIGGRPEYINFGTGWLVLVVSRVERYEKDKPKELTLIEKNESVSVVGQPEFLIGYQCIEGMRIKESDIPNKTWMLAKKNI